MYIPLPKRDGKLINRLIPIVLVGFDYVMDEKSKLYLRLLARLTDKAFAEYLISRECILQEIKDGDRLAYRFEIIDHLENCVNALRRASGIMYLLEKRKQELDIYKYVSKDTRKRIATKSIKDIRDQVEHMSRDIDENKFIDDLFLDVTDDYKSICINEKTMFLEDLSEMISIYHELMLEIFAKLPNRLENGKYY